jgi:hypothetical protein
MLRNSLPFALLLLIPYLTNAYTISVKGIVFLNRQEGLANAGVRISSLPGDSFRYDTVVIADSNGFFSLQIEVPDDNRKGTLLIYQTSCDPVQMKRIVYHPQHTRHEVNLHACLDCMVSIRAEKLDDTTYLLSAVVNDNRVYSYLWNTGDTTASITVTDRGHYQVMVRSSDGCHARDQWSWPDDRSCMTEIQVQRIASGSGTPGIKLTARSKGRPPFKYQWSTGDTTQSIRVDEPGEFCVSITDALGCTTRDCITIDTATGCKTEIRLLPAGTAADSSLILMAGSRGRPPFSYRWNTGDTTRGIRVTEPGEYCVEVTDADGCVSRDCLDLSGIAQSCKVTIHRTNSGHLVAKPRGLMPFTFLWNTGDTTRVIKTDTSGEYCVTATSFFGCVAEACITLDQSSNTFSPRNTPFDLYHANQPQNNRVALFASPNPAVNQVRLQWSSPMDGNVVRVLVTQMGGRPVIEQTLRAISGVNDLSLDVSQLETGIYFVKIIGEGINEQLKIIKTRGW